MNRIYQAKHKEKFIEQVKQKEGYYWLFNKTFDFEVKFSKDIFDFNKDQLLDFLSRGELKMTTLKHQRSIISSYIKWADKEGLKRTSTNAATEIKDRDLEKIAKPESNVLHVDTIYEIVGRPIEETLSFEPLRNRQDQLLIYLLFLGVMGRKANELIDLQFKHIEDGWIKLSELDPYRSDIRLDNFGMELVEKVRKENVYNRYIDEENIGINTHEGYKIDGSSYVFRKSTVGKKTGDDKITYSGLMARIDVISKHTGEELTMKRVNKSGMVYAGLNVLNARGSLNRKDKVVIEHIFDRYDVSTSDRIRYNTIRFIKEEIDAVYNSKEMQPQ